MAETLPDPKPPQDFPVAFRVPTDWGEIVVSEAARDEFDLVPIGSPVPVPKHFDQRFSLRVLSTTEVPELDDDSMTSLYIDDIQEVRRSEPIRVTLCLSPLAKEAAVQGINEDIGEDRAAVTALFKGLIEEDQLGTQGVREVVAAAAGIMIHDYLAEGVLPHIERRDDRRNALDLQLTAGAVASSGLFAAVGSWIDRVPDSITATLSLLSAGYAAWLINDIRRYFKIRPIVRERQGETAEQIAHAIAYDFVRLFTVRGGQDSFEDILRQGDGISRLQTPGPEL